MKDYIFNIRKVISTILRKSPAVYDEVRDAKKKMEDGCH
jgi:hypothetical protein